MKKITIGKSGIEASAVTLGCMRMGGMSRQEAAALIGAALDNGIDHFDHADIYADGGSEEVFGEVFDRSLRDQVVIQTKCGINRKPHGHYDFSKGHIVEAVEGSLKRLRAEYIDILLLHRPDTLMEPHEVAEAFTILQESGKVRHFGVSNEGPMQIELLKKYVKQPIVANQLQMSICHTPMIDAGLNVNMTNPPSVDHDGGVLEYCRIHDITIQAWSPFQYGFFEGVFLGSEKYPILNAVLDRIAEEKGVTNSAIAIAWILRHPANMQAIVGTTNAGRLRDICRAGDVELSRPEWYEIYKAAGNKLP